ncbi:MAG TPA: hypothetical protein VFG54_12250 [Prolixibacteraceae bacterium]|nr:hypothetical protein [Prolixibacteraceae bacterium]
MSSGIICTIKLDPFYQQFLRCQFQEFDPVFRFPKSHDLSLRFQFYLSRCPDGKQEKYGASEFKIEVPYMEHKSPLYYNFMSHNFQQKFQTRIREFWRDISHELMGIWSREGFSKEDIIQKVIEDFGFGPDDEERIRREYKRYRECERQRRYKRRNKMLKNVKILV